jgi:phosphate transport system permease protein
MPHGWHPGPRTWDRIARIVITAGGLCLVVAVAAILLFILREASPLAGRARLVAAPIDVPPAGDALAAGVDDLHEVVFVARATGVEFRPVAGGSPLATFPSPFAAGEAITTAAYDAGTGRLALGSARGHAALGQVDFEQRWGAAGREVVPQFRVRAQACLDSLGGPLEKVSGDRDEDGAVVLAGIGHDGRVALAHIDPEGATVVHTRLDSVLENRRPSAILVGLEAGVFAVGTADGTLYLWNLADPAAPVLEDHVIATESRIGALDFLIGEQSIVVGAADGSRSVWFRVPYARATNAGSRSVDVEGVELGPGASHVLRDRDVGRRYAHVSELQFQAAGRPWTEIRRFGAHGDPIVQIAPSPRAKGFASVDAAGRIVLQQSTSDRVLARFESHLASVRSASFAPRADGLVVVDAGGAVHLWKVEDAHPESGLRAFLGRVWYEGYADPEYVWQSTGGTQDFEPKLSLVPLFLGTLKGTLYAMLFSLPLAVLGALYLSQLATPGLRTVIKPLVELMAAVPSVVVGFLAALWLAPLVEMHLGPVLGAAIVLPAGLAAAIGVWCALPRTWKQSLRPGTELVFMLPFLVAAVSLGAHLGGPLEARLFGGDLRQWLYDGHGIRYDQRNCIVVGVALGFAVIPIIFSICEDAMSSVPPALVSAALALGASRWQTAVHVILPAASPGIFAAAMLGLGRAIGETMIVLMATGNTPILDFSPFDGMRTMSAAIAIEMPEAPHGGTLFRLLFLVGTLLFVFTFVLNTAADVVGRRLRRRYGQF